MQIIEIFFISGIILFLIILIIFINFILDELDKYFRINKFEKDYKSAILNNQIKWVDVRSIIQINKLKPEDIIFRIRKIHTEILIGREKDLNQYKDIIISHIEAYEEDEPFDNLPNGIKLHLEKIKEKLNTESILLEPLTLEITQILNKLNKNDFKHKMINWGSFIFGLFGLLLAIYTTFIEPNKINIPIDSSKDKKELTKEKEINVKPES